MTIKKWALREPSTGRWLAGEIKDGEPWSERLTDAMLFSKPDGVSREWAVLKTPPIDFLGTDVIDPMIQTADRLQANWWLVCGYRDRSPLVD